MGEEPKLKGTNKAPAVKAFTLDLDKRRAKALLTMLGAVELRMFERGFRPTESQLKIVAELRRKLSLQLYGEPEASLEEQLTAAIEAAQRRKE